MATARLACALVPAQRSAGKRLREVDVVQAGVLCRRPEPRLEADIVDFETCFQELIEACSVRILAGGT